MKKIISFNFHHIPKLSIGFNALLLLRGRYANSLSCIMGGLIFMIFLLTFIFSWQFIISRTCNVMIMLEALQYTEITFFSSREKIAFQVAMEILRKVLSPCRQFCPSFVLSFISSDVVSIIDI